jgi:hypothetical protein
MKLIELAIAVSLVAEHSRGARVDRRSGDREHGRRRRAPRAGRLMNPLPSAGELGDCRRSANRLRLMDLREWISHPALASGRNRSHSRLAGNRGGRCRVW